MTRSTKKPYTTISKPWDGHRERSFRAEVKQECQSCTFDPDRDFDEAQLQYKKKGDWGTKFGWPISPNESDDPIFHEDYVKSQRK